MRKNRSKKTLARQLHCADFPESQKAREIKFTKTKASEFLDDVEALPFERNLRRTHVTTLRRAMDDGIFNWGEVEIKLCDCAETNLTYRINGQHSCHARLQLDDDFADPTVRVKKYSADTFAQVRKLYASVDRGAGRTRGHVATAHLYGNPPFEDVSNKVIQILIQGFSFWQWTDTERRFHTTEEVTELMQTKFFDICSVVVDFYLENKRLSSDRMVKRAPVTAAIFATHEADPESAAVFWESVITGEMLKKNDAPYVLREKYLSKTLLHRKTASHSLSSGEIISSESVYRACIHAWNRWKSGRKSMKRFSIKSEVDRPVAK